MQTCISNYEFKIWNMKTALKLAVCCTTCASIITSPSDYFIPLSKQSWSVYCFMYFFCRISWFIVFTFPCPHITLSFHHSPMKDFKPLLTFPTVSDGTAMQTRVRIDGQWAGWCGCLPAPRYSPSTSGLLPPCLPCPYPILWHCTPELWHPGRFVTLQPPEHHALGPCPHPAPTYQSHMEGKIHLGMFLPNIFLPVTLCLGPGCNRGCCSPQRHNN